MVRSIGLPSSLLTRVTMFSHTTTATTIAPLEASSAVHANKVNGSDKSGRSGSQNESDTVDAMDDMDDDTNIDDVTFPPPLSAVDRLKRAATFWSTAVPIVAEEVLLTMGILSGALDQNFAKYLDAFMPHLKTALQNFQAKTLCAVGLGNVSDVANAVGPLAAIYSVISPEGAASILWRDSTRAREAATSMKITAEDLHNMGIVDSIIEEPVGGAHRNHTAVIETAGTHIDTALGELGAFDGDELRKQRREKFLAIGRNL